MPVHDWGRLHDGAFHTFHMSWLVHTCDDLNQHILPDTHYADIEPWDADLHTWAERDAEWLARFERRVPRPPRRVSVRQGAGHRLVAIILLVCRSHTRRREDVDRFAAFVTNVVQDGVHVLLIDVMRPGRHNPNGMHAEIWSRMDLSPYEPPPNKPLSISSYSCGGEVTAYLEPLAFGDGLSDMPLFLTGDCYVSVPLEAAYAAAWRGTPRFRRDILENPPPAP